MLLAINANNTNTVFAVWDGDALRGSWRASTDPKRTADEYVVWLDHLLAMEKLGRKQLTGTIIGSVVPEANFNLLTLCRRYCRSEPLMVGDTGVDIGALALVDRPEEVGADRLVNTVAAHERYKGPLIVVDFGTATTFDVVDRAGNYCGGAIAPGVNLSLTALHLAAAKLPSVRIRRTERIIGKNTVDCMQSGIYWGYVGLIEGIVGRIKHEFGDPMRVIATGGLAPVFDGVTDVIERVDPDLTLWGLRIIYRRNAK
ncbi:MAG TPA: type III pantothenate kinase [Stellaceae bacterium]|jgi:type III pantothenate kinase|nr:type III pantothenate kinase [Stellaceae bacterium]